MTLGCRGKVLRRIAPPLVFKEDLGPLLVNVNTQNSPLHLWHGYHAESESFNVAQSCKQLHSMLFYKEKLKDSYFVLKLLFILLVLKVKLSILEWHVREDDKEEQILDQCPCHWWHLGDNNVLDSFWKVNLARCI